MIRCKFSRRRRRFTAPEAVSIQRRVGILLPVTDVTGEVTNRYFFGIVLIVAIRVRSVEIHNQVIRNPPLGESWRFSARFKLAPKLKSSGGLGVRRRSIISNAECTGRQQGARARERLHPDRDEWVSFHAGPPAPLPTAPHDLPGYNVVTHDLWVPNGGLASAELQTPDYGRSPLFYHYPTKLPYLFAAL